jgi:hypothetical protein
MGKYKVKVSDYLGNRAVDYAKNYWNKVVGSDAGDGRVLSSGGVVPACGSSGFPDGTEFLHEAGISQAYGGPTQTDFIVIPASGSSWQTKTESFTFKALIVEKLKAKIQEAGDKGVNSLSESYILSETLVKSIDSVTLETDDGSVSLERSDWPDLKDFMRHDREEPKSTTAVRLIVSMKPDSITAYGSKTPTPKGAKFSVSYTYTDKGRRLSFGPIDDCSHFVSCCLIAGGLPVWPNDHPLVGGSSRPCAKGQHGVPGLYKMLLWMSKKENGALTEMVVDKKPWKIEGKDDTASEKEWIDLFNDKMLPGDVVLYHKKGGGFMHSALYVGTMQTTKDAVDFPRISCHTYCRYPTDECTWDTARWDLGRTDENWSYTLIHIKPYEPTTI